MKKKGKEKKEKERSRVRSGLAQPTRQTMCSFPSWRVASSKSLSRVPDPHQRRRSPLLFRLHTTARPHEWLLCFPPPLSGCPALLPSPPDVLLCSSLRPSASPSSLSSASPSSLVSALRSTAAAVSPSRSPACSSLCAVFLRASLSACVPISPARQLSLRTPVCRPELDPCMAPATHDLARIGRQSDDFWTSRS